MVAPKLPSTVPTSPLTTRQLELSLWYAKHKLTLRRVLSLTLLGFDVLLMLVALVGTIRLVSGYGRYQAMLRQLANPAVDFGQLREEFKPQPLGLSSVSALVSGGRGDLVATVSNPNEHFAATDIRYRFSANGTPLPEQHTYLLPGDQRQLLSLGVDGVGPGSAVGVEILDVRWMRQQRADEFRAQRHTFQVFDPTVTTQPLPGGSDTTVAEFRFRNGSARGFWEVNLAVLLYNGDSLVGVAATRVDQLQPLQDRVVTVRWVEPLPSATRIVVEPEVNVYDESVYLPYQPDR